MKLIFATVFLGSLLFGASTMAPDLAHHATAVVDRLTTSILASVSPGVAMKDTQPSQTPQRFITTAVNKAHIERTVSATGTLKAISTVEVSSQLSGQVAKLHADFNDRVHAEDYLATLDRRGFRAHVTQARAELDMARENVRILRAKLDRMTGEEREADARREIFKARSDNAGIALASAERNLRRAQTLADKGVGSKSALEDAQAARDSARTQLREAKAEAAAHDHIVSARRAARMEAEAELANAKAALPLKKAALTLAELDLERSVIRAPIDGVVVGRHVEQGQTVAASLDAPVLFTIAGDLSRMEIHANIDETDIGEIRPGQQASFTVNAFPDRTFTAEVREIRKSARVVRNVVTYIAVLDATNTENLLLPGMTATVRISVEKTGETRTIPLAALRFDPNGTIAEPEPSLAGAKRRVWVLTNGRLDPREIRIGPDDGRNVAVVEGDVATGDRVVTGEVPQAEDDRIFGIRF